MPIHPPLQGGAFSAPAGKKIQMHGKTNKYERMGCTYWYAGLAERSQAMSEDAVQRSRWTFYKVVKNKLSILHLTGNVTVVNHLATLLYSTGRED